MKKYILILFSIISFWSCTEDESIDITVLPSVTTTGANTFGCLMDGWIYVGGRYLNWGHSYVCPNAQFKQKQRKVKMREMNCKWLRMSNIS